MILQALLWCVFFCAGMVVPRRWIDIRLNPPFGWRDALFVAALVALAVVSVQIVSCAALPPTNVGFCLACFETHAPEPGYERQINYDGFLCGRGSGTADQRPNAEIGLYLGEDVDGKVFGNGRFDLNGNGRIDLEDWAINARWQGTTVG